MVDNKIDTSSIAKTIYIVTNIVVSGIGFLRSFVFMKVLSVYDLGILTIIQTIIALIPVFQFGLINGGYRIVSLNIYDQNEKVNNLMFSLFGLITILILVFWVCSLFIQIQLSRFFLLIALIVGVMNLVVNWLTNILIGRQSLRQLNIINLFSGIGSLLLLPLSFIWGLGGVILVLTAQPLIFILFAVTKDEKLRPTRFYFDVKLIKYILSFGFIPFLTGIFTLINLQIERWVIVKYLGIEEMGNFYLVFLFSTIFVLVPNALNNLFFPVCVKYFSENKLESFKCQIKKYVFMLLIYILLVIVLAILFLETTVSLLFPQHINNVKYVFLYIPGLAILSLCGPISLIFNSSVKLKPLFLAGFLSVALNLILITIIYNLRYISLSFMACIKSIINIFIFVFYLFSFVFIKHEIFETK
jgi:O-antigen/teichoic acid export membrane protein